jgi:ribosomal protein L11 methyltransferase
VETSAEAEDAVGQLLERICGAPPSSCTDAETGAVTVTVFRERKRSNPRPRRSHLVAGLEFIRACGLDLGPARLSVRTLPMEDWAESWKRHFKPIEVSPGLLVQPSWSRRQPRPGQAVVILDPGLSFGTGQHPTTAFCLKQLARARQPERAQNCLDVGCGSGILAIAAAKLGYAPADGLDTDSDAVRQARLNAARNGVAVRFRKMDLRQLPTRRPRRFDIVCANLTSDLLLAQTQRLVQQVRPGGLLVLAGMLAQQFEDVRAAYERAGLCLESSATVREWRSGAFRRP